MHGKSLLELLKNVLLNYKQNVSAECVLLHRVLGVEMKQGVYCICPLRWSVHCNLYVMVNIVKGGGGEHSPPSPAWANFSIMMECTPEIGRCHSLCAL
jgi:hypothetical protein